jgi:dolichyl-phosphate-mannose-protein mannosyltransferase
MGTLAVALLYLLARKILQSRLGGAVAASLLAIDWLHFVQSRTAMLDVFICTFAIAAFLFLVYDRDRLVQVPGTIFIRDGPSVLNRPWRVASGAIAGAALATKWSGGLILVAVLGLTAAWEVGARRARGITHPLRRALKEEWPSVAVGLIAIPLLIYLLSYAGTMHGTLFTLPWNEGSWFREFLRRQVQIFQFHHTLVGVHPYGSAGWTWPLLKRPTLYFFDSAGGSYREILAVGNPLVWWPALAALLYIAARWVRRRDFSKPDGIILVGFAANYMPWIYLSRVRILGFLYYLVPAIPWMCVALALVAVRAWRSSRGRIIVIAGLLIAVGLFAFYYPILAAVPVSPSFWKAHMLFRDCQGALQPGIHGLRPPPGWCWI